VLGALLLLLLLLVELLLHVGVVLARDGDEAPPSRKPLRRGLPGGVFMLHVAGCEACYERIIEAPAASDD
jgi:hypothetical protein